MEVIIDVFFSNEGMYPKWHLFRQICVLGVREGSAEDQRLRTTALVYRKLLSDVLQKCFY